MSLQEERKDCDVFFFPPCDPGFLVEQSTGDKGPQIAVTSYSNTVLKLGIRL